MLGNSKPGRSRRGLGDSEEEEERAAGSGCWGDQRGGEKKGGQEGGKEGNGKKNVQTMFGQGVMFVQDRVPKIPPVPSAAGGGDGAPARLLPAPQGSPEPGRGTGAPLRPGRAGRTRWEVSEPGPRLSLLRGCVLRALGLLAFFGAGQTEREAEGGSASPAPAPAPAPLPASSPFPAPSPHPGSSSASRAGGSGTSLSSGIGAVGPSPGGSLEPQPSHDV